MECRTRLLVWQGKTAPPDLPFLRSHHHTTASSSPRSPYELPAQMESTLGRYGARCARFSVWRGESLVSPDLPFLASHHHHHHRFLLTPRTLSMIRANYLHTRPIQGASYLVIGLAGRNPGPCSSSLSWLPTMSTPISTLAYILLIHPPP
jgi:hypothetical protein